MQCEDKPPVSWCTSQPSNSQPANDTAAGRSLICPTSPPPSLPPLPFALLQVTVSQVWSVLGFNLILHGASRSLGLMVFETHWRQFAKKRSDVRMTTTVRSLCTISPSSDLMTGQLRVFLETCLSTLTKMSHCFKSFHEAAFTHSTTYLTWQTNPAPASNMQSCKM